MKPLITPSSVPLLSRRRSSNIKATNNDVDVDIDNLKADLLMKLMKSCEGNDNRWKNGERGGQRLGKRRNSKADNVGHVQKSQTSLDFESEEFYEIPTGRKAPSYAEDTSKQQMLPVINNDSTDKPASQQYLPFPNSINNKNVYNTNTSYNNNNKNNKNINNNNITYKNNTYNQVNQKNIPGYLHGNSRKSITEDTNQSSYERYPTQIDKLNLETESTGVSPLPIITPIPSEEIVSPTSIDINKGKLLTKRNKSAKKTSIRKQPLLLPPIYSVRPRPLKEREFLTPTRIPGPITDDDWEDLFQCRYLRHLASRHSFKIHTQ